jgi:hypothetical protein
MMALEGLRDGTWVADVLKLEPGGWWIKIQTQLALTSYESNKSIGNVDAHLISCSFGQR